MPLSKSRFNLGFTLVEVLVTMTIISVLFGIVATTYTAAQKNTRDATRKSDLRTIQSGLEHYFADQGYYPTTVYPSGRTTLDSCIDMLICTNRKTYLNKVPKDPSTGNSYTYSPSNSVNGSCDNTTSNICTKYCLYTTLEFVPASPLPTSPCGSYPGTTNYFVTLP